MSTIRRCDHKGCNNESADLSKDLNPLYTTFPIGSRETDLCPTCTKDLEAWVKGEKVMVPAGVNVDVARKVAQAIVDVPLPESAVRLRESKGH